jgi:hypothetical protein
LKENFDRFQFDIYKEKEMADFRKCTYVLAVFALLLGTVSTASAQTFQCIANAGVPALLRAEGLTELNGEVTINCTGNPLGWPVDGAGVPLPTSTGVTGIVPPAGVTPATVNIQVFLNTNVTSRLLADPWTEAMLLIDDPATSVVACTLGTPYTLATPCNAFQGRVVGANSILFLGVPVLPPASAGGQRVYRITNVRANATAVAPGGSGTPGQVITLISATPATSGLNAVAGVISSSFPVNNPQQITGFVQIGLLGEGSRSGGLVRNATGGDLATTFAFQQCISRGIDTAARRAVTGFARARFVEGFATSFKTRTAAQTSDYTSPIPVSQSTPGFIYNSESGYYNPLLPAALCPGALSNCAGLADQGTRLKATFTNVPNGVRLFVSVTDIGPGGGTQGQLQARLTGTETGPFFPVAALTDVQNWAGGPLAGVSVAEIIPVSGTATAVWEVTRHNPLAIETVDFSIHAAITTVDVANNIPAAPSQAQVSLSFAPINTTATSSGFTVPIPRFADLGTARNLFALRICVTNLLFPFVTAQSGFDTGLAISNTSRDIFGTSVQSGSCTLNPFGANAPAAITTPTVTPDAVYVTVASTSMPNFQGYVIAQCRFQYAHGFAFISDLGARNLAMGYLALVIPALGDNSRAADPFPNAGGGSGEQLGN